MKRITITLGLLGLLTAAQHAVAANIAYLHNNAGGLIVLTDERRECPQGYAHAFATGEPDRRLDGCSGIGDTHVVVFWFLHGSEAYPITDFTKFTRI
jgi:hypothetical protein